MFDITFRWPNTDQWTADMSRFQGDLDLNAMKIAGAQIVQNFHEIEIQLFQSEGANGMHGVWPALSEKYQEWKDRHFPGMPIMILTTLLMRSLTEQTTGTIAHVSKVGQSWRLKFGTDVKSPAGFDYPLLHQKGGDIKGKTKTRRTIDPTDKQVAVWAKIIQRHIVNSSYKYVHAFDKVTIGTDPTIDRFNRNA
jgi:hypothetical protein